MSPVHPRGVTCALAILGLLGAAGCFSFDARSDDYICEVQADCTDDRVCTMGYCVVAGADIDASTDGSTSDGPQQADAALPFVSAPLPAIALTPAAGTTATVFNANASATTDIEDLIGTISFSWDWEGDGTFEDTGLSATHSYGLAGSYNLVLRAEDPAGNVAFKQYQVIVVSEANLISVSTGTDESDANATPLMPGGAGLSLREAIDYSNNTAGRQLIVVPPGTTTMIGSQLPALDDAAGVDLVGDGAIVDGTNATGSACLVTGGDDNLILGIEFQNCKGDAFRDANGSANNVISRCKFRDSPSGVRASGVNLVVGPDNSFSGHSGHAVDLAGVTLVKGNRISNSMGAAIFIASSAQTSVVEGNTIDGNEVGIQISTSATGATLRHNTIDANGTGVMLAASNVTLIDFRNNIVSNSSTIGLSGMSASFSELDYSNFFSNGSADCSGCATLGASSTTAGPQYIGGGDLRLRSTSTLIDAALDLGGDVNGPGAGNFNGSAPDMGGHEAPQ